MREAKRAALFVPTILEGIAQSARADASHASGRRRTSSCPHHFCPCGVVQPTCLPLMQEITGAKPVRDAILSARGSRGKADPPDSESGSLGRASRLAPTIFKAPKALSVMRSLGRRANSVQLRVGDPILVAVCQGGRPPGPQSSQRSSRFHKPAQPRAALGIATILRAASINE